MLELTRSTLVSNLLGRRIIWTVQNTFMHTSSITELTRHRMETRNASITTLESYSMNFGCCHSSSCAISGPSVQRLRKTSSHYTTSHGPRDGSRKGCRKATSSPSHGPRDGSRKGSRKVANPDRSCSAQQAQAQQWDLHCPLEGNQKHTLRQEPGQCASILNDGNVRS
jgi:hypothetical protein